MKRTHLPLNGLRVLDAAARHLSFTKAADELAVTPAAVGQQIRALEDMLGVVLFRRTPKGLELTDEASNGLDALRAGFLQFEESVRAMQAGQSSNSLTIAAPRDFTAKWLAARLATYGKANPETRFTLVSADDEVDFTEANLDLAIRLTDGPGDCEGVKLAEGAFVTVAAPEGGADTPISWPRCPVADGVAALRLGDAGLAIDAAAIGLGRANVPLLLAEADLAAGRVRALDNTKESQQAYWLLAPLPQWRQKKVKSLVEALTGGVTLPTLRTQRLVLRPLVPEDARDAHRFLSDERVMRYWSSGPHADISETERYIVGNCTGGSHESWAITESGGPAIGWINLCERRPGIYETGYILGADSWGRGFAREAVSAGLDHVFGAFGARRIFADTDPENVGSIKMLEGLGFTREGRLRGEWETHIGVRDSLIFGILRDEWRNAIT